MADIVDQAEEYQQKELNQLLKSITQHTEKPELIQGICHYCQDKVVGLFCDDDCREDYEKEQRLNQQNGLIKR